MFIYRFIAPRKPTLEDYAPAGANAPGPTGGSSARALNIYIKAVSSPGFDVTPIPHTQQSLLKLSVIAPPPE